MRGCSVHYHETLDLTDSVDAKLIDPPKNALRSYREGIDELVSSVREKGLIQPIIVRPTGSRFEVVAGARRLEACKRLRWSRVPCIIRELTDKDSFEISLSENIQRKTMNAIEEAEAFRRYIDQNGWGGESQLARKIGKSQEYVSQRLSLLTLPRGVQHEIIRHQINPSAAQEIARLSDPKIQTALSEHATKLHMTVGMIRESANSIRKGASVDVAVKRVQLRRQVAQGRFSMQEQQELSQPEFMRNLLKSSEALEFGSDVRDLDKAILILKLALSRLGSLIDELPEESPVKDLLLEKRLSIHGMIDSLIKVKIKIGGRMPSQISA
ncbi:MAG: ParB/RepB/Spo0J family partition protein [Nitrososphaerota archaeon]|nr:ParB/RepB/Spo0J family partition protein [Nitrososphaerota archaeon]